MKKFLVLFFIPWSLQVHSASAQEERFNRTVPTQEATKEPVRASGLAQRAAVVRQNAADNHSAVINMSQPANGPVNNAPVFYPPAYGQIQWQTEQAPPPDNNAPPQTAAPEVTVPTPTPVPSAKVVHHHPYTPGYIRKRLQKIGVKASPSYITDRKEIIFTDRKHSTFKLPKKGQDGKPISAQMVSPRNFTDAMVRTRMEKINDPVVLKKIVPLMQVESKANHYYWHKADGYVYCHMVDSWGFHWYGWYEGDRTFWTRYYSGRWWFYDSDYGRWCFWHAGFWWW